MEVEFQPFLTYGSGLVHTQVTEAMVILKQEARWALDSVWRSGDEKNH
jgi:hypothetical protein